MHQDTHDHENMQCDIPINRQLRAHFMNFQQWITHTHNTQDLCSTELIPATF